ncbi:hypothetical protein BGZ99_006865 [Dissophora globulifera]|uniref:Uncharacterized protein n=1 Tax=Dissophora globulifera TaxID=979702 RepID=A0A9P6RBB9_9FUNG|nr:hypothetical protein BGZ99_006865 [Dissophora globulifera]
MLNHDYPAWHKPAQRALFLIAVVLGISLPVIYGSSRKPRRISAQAMGAILGAYFGLWAVFSLVVRFLVPSPKAVSTLPTYTPEPIPEPVFLHSPSRADALPSSPAIRSSTAISQRAVVRGPRFANDDDDIVVEEASALSPTIAATPAAAGAGRNNVTFQAHLGGYASGSNSSEAAYPTFAAYRQSQRGNFDAFAQRIKRAFETSQQEREQLQQQQQLKQELQDQQQVGQVGQAGNEGLGLQPLTQAAGSVRSINNTANTSTVSLSNDPNPNSTAWSRSTSGAVSVFGDLAERIRNGSIFTRSQNFLPATRSSADPATASQTLQPQHQHSEAASTADISVMELMASTSVEAEQGDGNKNHYHFRDGSVPVPLVNLEPLADEKEEKKSLERINGLQLRRTPSEDTVVVTMDGIQRPSVNQHQVESSVEGNTAEQAGTYLATGAAAGPGDAIVSPAFTDTSTLSGNGSDKDN